MPKKSKLLPVEKIAAKIGLAREDLELYGDYKARVKYEAIRRIQKGKHDGKLILVTAITPTPAGEAIDVDSDGKITGLF